MSLFWTGSLEALLKFVTLLNNIIWGQELSIGIHKFGTTIKLVVVEALRVFEKKNCDK